MLRPKLIILQPTAYCNISCSYCYLKGRDNNTLMSREVIEAVREKIVRHLPRDSTAGIVWHSGEPTTAPIGWYEYAYDRLEGVRPRHSNFAMQSNGIAIDDRWIDFLNRTGTRISLSIDGPQRFHDARRRTRNGRPTWSLAIRALRRLQSSGVYPQVITVLHPEGLSCSSEYYRFYRDHDIAEVSFSIDELEGANAVSSFCSPGDKAHMVEFLTAMLGHAFADGFPLHIREIERIAHILSGVPSAGNEQVEPFAVIVVTANGDVSTFSPELVDVDSAEYNDFVFGNILTDSIESISETVRLQSISREIADGVSLCKQSCRYFEVCGGGAPVNKYCEKGTFVTSETDFCRLGTQAAADALFGFISGPRKRSVITACNQLHAETDENKGETILFGREKAEVHVEN